MMNISDKTVKALLIIRDNPGIRPRKFAELMWAGSESWLKVGRVGHGASKGVGLVLKGGGYLGKLRQERLVNAFNELTAQGKEVLTQTK